MPLTVQALPSGSSSVSATTLLTRIRSSSGIAYSAYAQSTGGLALPADTGPFDLGGLFGATSRLRVWRRDAQNWRVDSIDSTGERDLHHDAADTWSWNYASNEAQRTAKNTAPVRLPRADDLAPANLARRLVSQRGAAKASRLCRRSVAARSFSPAVEPP